jgi:hypothetical protein
VSYLVSNIREVNEVRKRYSNMPSKFLIRKCYRDLYTVGIRDLESKSVIAFTGVPGIGKSMFLLYFVSQLVLDSQFKNVSFALEFKAKEFVIFEPIEGPNNESTYKIIRSKEVSEDVLVFSDIVELVPPSYESSKTIAFCSPNPGRLGKQYNQYTYKIKYFVPTWTREELEQLPDVPDDWLDKYKIVGGVPRQILSDMEPMLQQLEETLSTKGNDIANQVFTKGLGTSDDDQSYALIHINPARDPTTCKIDYAKKIFSFASPNILTWATKINIAQLKAKAINIFNNDDPRKHFSGGSAGLYLERLCLWISPICGQSLEMKRLVDDGISEETLILQLPKERNDFSSLRLYVNGTNKLAVNTFYVPSYTTLESCDAFCLMDDANEAGKYILLMIQITVAKTHPVKANGLNEIYKAYSTEATSNISRMILLFVTHHHSQMNKMQNITNQQSAVMDPSNIPVKIRDMRQYIWKYEFPVIDTTWDVTQDE